MKNQRGFTIVELLITLAMVGIIVAIAVPSLYRARLTQSLTALKMPADLTVPPRPSQKVVLSKFLQNKYSDETTKLKKCVGEVELARRNIQIEIGSLVNQDHTDASSASTALASLGELEKRLDLLNSPDPCIEHKEILKKVEFVAKTYEIDLKK